MSADRNGLDAQNRSLAARIAAAQGGGATGQSVLESVVFQMLASAEYHGTGRSPDATAINRALQAAAQKLGL